MEALDDQTLRVRILQKEPKIGMTLSILPAVWRRSTSCASPDRKGTNKSRFARAAAGGKESTISEGAKVSEEIVKQLADLKVLMSSCRRDLDRQQQEITLLKMSHQPSYSRNWNLSPDSHPAG